MLLLFTGFPLMIKREFKAIKVGKRLSNPTETITKRVVKIICSHFKFMLKLLQPFPQLFEWKGFTIFTGRNQPGNKLLSMIKKIEISGRPTLPAGIFIGGKAAGYFTWVMLLLTLTGHSSRNYADSNISLIAYTLLLAGIVLIVTSSFTLGKDIRIGLPTHKTVLRTRGIYKMSRNPMYLGVHLVTLAAILLTLKWWVALPGLLSIYIYHLIILGEERFLAESFGEAYLEYRKSTGRYW